MTKVLTNGILADSPPHSDSLHTSDPVTSLLRKWNALAWCPSLFIFGSTWTLNPISRGCLPMGHWDLEKHWRKEEAEGHTNTHIYRLSSGWVSVTWEAEIKSHGDGKLQTSGLWLRHPMGEKHLCEHTNTMAMLKGKRLREFWSNREYLTSGLRTSTQYVILAVWG